MIGGARSPWSTTYNDILEAIHQFHDRISACVRRDDGKCSGWFDVARGLRQGFLLSPLLLNVFFAAILLIAQEIFSEGADELADLVHLQ